MKRRTGIAKQTGNKLSLWLSTLAGIHSGIERFAANVTHRRSNAHSKVIHLANWNIHGGESVFVWVKLNRLKWRQNNEKRHSIFFP
jgi:hypothetical protein